MCREYTSKKTDEQASTDEAPIGQATDAEVSEFLTEVEKAIEEVEKGEVDPDAPTGQLPNDDEDEDTDEDPAFDLDDSDLEEVPNPVPSLPATPTSGQLYA